MPAAAEDHGARRSARGGLVVDRPARRLADRGGVEGADRVPGVERAGQPRAHHRARVDDPRSAGSPTSTPPDGEHIKNDVGRSNEVWVEAYRDRPGAEVLEEFRAVTGERLARAARAGHGLRRRVVDAGRPGDGARPAAVPRLRLVGARAGHAPRGRPARRLGRRRGARVARSRSRRHADGRRQEGQAGGRHDRGVRGRRARPGASS